VHARRHAGRELDDAENRSTGSVVPTVFSEASESPELSAGIASVVQTTQAEAPGRFETTFFDTSSIFTTARPLPSCRSPLAAP